MTCIRVKLERRGMEPICTGEILHSLTNRRSTNQKVRLYFSLYQLKESQKVHIIVNILTIYFLNYLKYLLIVYTYLSMSASLTKRCC